MKKTNVLASILALAILMPLVVQSGELEDAKAKNLLEAFLNQAMEATQDHIEKQKLGEPGISETSANEIRYDRSISSQLRFEGEDYLSALKRHKNRLGQLGIATKGLWIKTARAEMVPYDQVDFSAVPVVDDFKVLTQSFTRLRDTRFLTTSDRPDFLRRLPWLYPDEGCYFKAAITVIKLQEWNYVRPYKAFVFGNLVATTPNSPTGVVRWWYHMAPIVSVKGEIYVYDATINPCNPMLFKDWVLSMVEVTGDAEVSICNSYTDGPIGSNCYGSISYYEPTEHQNHFLGACPTLELFVQILTTFL